MINVLRARTQIRFADGDVYTVIGRPARMLSILGKKVPADAARIDYIASGEIIRKYTENAAPKAFRRRLLVRMVDGEIVAADRGRIGRGWERAGRA